MQRMIDFATLQQQALHATVIRACRNCGEPGIDTSGRPVGLVCPNCGADRPPDEPKGMIWSRRITVFGVLRDRLQALWKGLFHED